jgi:hypothetical protein
MAGERPDEVIGSVAQVERPVIFQARLVSLYAGGPTNNGASQKLLWFREMRRDGVSLSAAVPWYTHAIAVSADKTLLAYGGGGETTSYGVWRHADEGEIRILSVAAIERGMAEHRRLKEADLAKRKTTAESTRIDGSAILSSDPPELPWE